MLYRGVIEEPNTSDGTFDSGDKQFGSIITDSTSESGFLNNENKFVYVKSMHLIIFVSNVTHYRENDEYLVYEIPPDKYSAERVIKILLDPNINKKKICHQQPTKIANSSTYVVDLNSLKDPEDVKKDSFGVWNHSGSHLQSFECCFSKDGRVHVGRGLFQEASLQWETFSLRRLHSKHPSNINFRQILCFITGIVRSITYICSYLAIML